MTMYPKKSPYLWKTGYALGKGQVSEKTVYDTAPEKESQFKKPYFFNSHAASERFYAPQLPYFEGISGWTFPTPSLTGNQVSPYNPLTGGWETYCSFAVLASDSYCLKVRYISPNDFRLLYVTDTYTNLYYVKTTNQGKSWSLVGGNLAAFSANGDFETTLDGNSIVTMCSVWNVILEYYATIISSISTNDGVTWTSADVGKDSYLLPNSTFTSGSDIRFLFLWGGTTYLRDTATLSDNDLGFVAEDYLFLLRKVGDISYAVLQYNSDFYFVKMVFPWAVLKYRICDYPLGGTYLYSYTANATFEIVDGTFLFFQVIYGSKKSPTSLGNDWWVYIRCFKSTTGIDWTEEKVLEYNVIGSKRLSEPILFASDDSNYYICHPVSFLAATNYSTYPLVLFIGKNEKGTSTWKISESTIEHEFGGTDFFVNNNYCYFINRTSLSFDFLRKPV